MNPPYPLSDTAADAGADGLTVQLEFFPGQLETVLRCVPMMNAVNTTAADGPEEIQAPAPRVPATPPHRIRGEGSRKGGFRSFLLLRSRFNSSLFAHCSTPFFGVRPAFNAGFLSVLRLGKYAKSSAFSVPQSIPTVPAVPAWSPFHDSTGLLEKQAVPGFPFVPRRKTENQDLRVNERRGMMSRVGRRLESFTG